VTKGSDPLSDDRPAMLEAVLGPDVRAQFQPADALVMPLERPALLLITQDADTPLAVERLGMPIGLIPLPGPNRGVREGIRLIDLPARSVIDWVTALGVVNRGEAAPRTERIGLIMNSRVHYGEVLDVVTVWPGPVVALRPTIVLDDAGGERTPERDNPRRRPLEVAADQVLLLRHQVPISVRIASGDARVIVERTLDGGRLVRTDLGAVSVLAR